MEEIEIHYQQIESDTLRKLVEEFIMREGTDYGAVEMELDQKIDMVIHQLKKDAAIITWNTTMESYNIVLKQDIEKIVRDKQMQSLTNPL